MGTVLPVLGEGCRVPRPRPVSSRATFAQLRRSRRRAWSGPVRVQFLPAPDTEQSRQVAYAVPRKVGTAVERNLVRRRLRAVVADTAAAIPAGAYLVGIDQGVRGLPFQELRTKVIEAMQRASQMAPR
jgi:ribonuclease P protein component